MRVIMSPTFRRSAAALDFLKLMDPKIDNCIHGSPASNARLMSFWNSQLSARPPGTAFHVAEWIQAAIVEGGYPADCTNSVQGSNAFREAINPFTVNVWKIDFYGVLKGPTSKMFDFLHLPPSWAMPQVWNWRFWTRVRIGRQCWRAISLIKCFRCHFQVKVL